MFDLGDVIVYGFEGVFTVSEYTTSPIDKNDPRVFYVLTPTFGQLGNIIMAPSEGGTVLMRSVIDREAAIALIESIPSIMPLTVERERNRRELYKTVMSRGKCEDYVSIIKTVRKRRDDFLAQKRRISETDADYESMAKRSLYSELALALDKTFEEIEQIVCEKL